MGRQYCVYSRTPQGTYLTVFEPGKRMDAEKTLSQGILQKRAKHFTFD